MIQCNVKSSEGNSMLLDRTTKNTRLKTPGARKLLPKNDLDKVVKRVSAVAYQPGLPQAVRTHAVFHESLQLLRLYKSDGEVQPPPPHLVEWEEDFDMINSYIKETGPFARVIQTMPCQVALLNSAVRILCLRSSHS